MDIASINVDPRRGNTILDGLMTFIFQNGWSLEEYVEEFLGACHLASCNDICLMERFWCGLDDDIRFVMPREDPLWTLKDYINFALWVEGSTLTADEEDAVGDINVQPHLADVSQHDPEPSQPSPRFAEHEPEPKMDREPEPSLTDEPSPSGATELWIAQEPEPILSDQVREPATEPVTVDVPDGREGAEDSTTHCTAAEGEQRRDLGQLNMEVDLIFSEDIKMELPACPEQSICLELSTCLNFPPTLPLPFPSSSPAASGLPPLFPDSPSAHPQPTLCAVGSPRVCQSPSASWLEDPSSSPPASESWILPRPSGPALHPGSQLPRLHRHPSAHQLHQAPSSLRLQLGQSSSRHRPASPCRSVPPAPLGSSLPPAPPQSSVTPVPPRTSGSPPQPSGSSVSPWIFGFPFSPWATSACSTAV
ncbi:hypothetical protein M9458_028943, partial [Cirrhinus mrigala]